jgi:predicted O-methyltransferase YrrM
MSLLSYLPTPVKRLGRKIIGDRFQNHGEISDRDFIEIRTAMDRIRPSVFIEVGTGKGISTKRIFSHLVGLDVAFDLYSIEIFAQHHARIAQAIRDPRFHPILGLSVRIEETTDPARSELATYNGPQNVLRSLLDTELAGRTIDLAFIDSRKGSALAEFKVLAARLSSDGTIFCHDVLNGGKGVEVLQYLKDHSDHYDFDVIDTGPDGIIRIGFRSPRAH